MKKTYIIPQIVEKELRFAEDFLSLSKGYIQNPDGTSTGDNITIEDNYDRSVVPDVFSIRLACLLPASCPLPTRFLPASKLFPEFIWYLWEKLYLCKREEKKILLIRI